MEKHHRPQSETGRIHRIPSEDCRPCQTRFKGREYSSRNRWPSYQQVRHSERTRSQINAPITPPTNGPKHKLQVR